MHNMQSNSTNTQSAHHCKIYILLLVIYRAKYIMNIIGNGLCKYWCHMMRKAKFWGTRPKPARPRMRSLGQDTVGAGTFWGYKHTFSVIQGGTQLTRGGAGINKNVTETFPYCN